MHKGARAKYSAYQRRYLLIPSGSQLLHDLLSWLDIGIQDLPINEQHRRKPGWSAGRIDVQPARAQLRYEPSAALGHILPQNQQPPLQSFEKATANSATARGLLRVDRLYHSPTQFVKQMLGGKIEPTCQLLCRATIQVQRLYGLADLRGPFRGLDGADMELRTIAIRLHLQLHRRNHPTT
jgi:hypothetical protein